MEFFQTDRDENRKENRGSKREKANDGTCARLFGHGRRAKRTLIIKSEEVNQKQERALGSKRGKEA